MKASLSWCEAARTVFVSGRAKVASGLTFVVACVVYLLTLPATFTGGHPGLGALAYLTPGLAVWACVLAALLALLVPTTFYLLARGYGKRSGAAGATGGAVGLALSLVTPLLCCTPFLPVAFAALATWLPFVSAGAGGAFQGFLATHEGLFFAVSSLLLLGALAWNLHEITKNACCTL